MTAQNPYFWTGMWLIGIVAIVVGTYNLVIASLLGVHVLAGYRAIGVLLLGAPPTPPFYLYDGVLVLLGWMLTRLSSPELNESGSEQR